LAFAPAGFHRDEAHCKGRIAIVRERDLKAHDAYSLSLLLGSAKQQHFGRLTQRIPSNTNVSKVKSGTHSISHSLEDGLLRRPTHRQRLCRIRRVFAVFNLQRMQHAAGKPGSEPFPGRFYAVHAHHVTSDEEMGTT